MRTVVSIYIPRLLVSPISPAAGQQSSEMDQIPGNRRDPVEGNPYIDMVYEKNRKRTGEEERNEEWYLQQIHKRLKQEK